MNGGGIEKYQCETCVGGVLPLASVALPDEQPRYEVDRAHGPVQVVAGLSDEQ